MPDRTNQTDDDDDIAAGRELADELKCQARRDVMLLRAIWARTATSPDEPLGLAS